MASAFSITETPAVAPSLERLSFTGYRDDGGINLWNPVVIIDSWPDACNVGRQYGREAVNYIRESGDCASLPAIVRIIARRGVFTGVETGFFTAVAMALSA